MSGDEQLGRQEKQGGLLLPRGMQPGPVDSL